jgi:putative transposase
MNSQNPTATGALLPTEDSRDTLGENVCRPSSVGSTGGDAFQNPAEHSRDGELGTCADCPQSASEPLPVFQSSALDSLLPTEDSRDTFQDTSQTPALKPLNKDAPISKTRRTLPHWEQAGCTYFVTFRLADAVAAPVWKQWRAERAAFHDQHPKPWDTATQKEYNAQFPAQMERWADAGHGSCALADPALRALVVQAMQHFDGVRYTLGDFVLMPNHAHVLVTPHDGHSLKDILTGWKRTSGHSILKLIPGPKPFWMDEDFDHAVRSEKQLAHFQNYIAENPSKASLRAGTWTHYAAKAMCPDCPQSVSVPQPEDRATDSLQPTEDSRHTFSGHAARSLTLIASLCLLLLASNSPAQTDFARAASKRLLQVAGEPEFDIGCFRVRLRQ